MEGMLPEETSPLLALKIRGLRCGDMARHEGGLSWLRVGPDGCPPKRRGPQSYNHKDLNFATTVSAWKKQREIHHAVPGLLTDGTMH